MVDYPTLEPFINSSFAIAISVYLLYERTKCNEKILTSLQEISYCIKDLKDEYKSLRREN